MSLLLLVTFVLALLARGLRLRFAGVVVVVVVMARRLVCTIVRRVGAVPGRLSVVFVRYLFNGQTDNQAIKKIKTIKII